MGEERVATELAHWTPPPMPSRIQYRSAEKRNFNEKFGVQYMHYAAVSQYKSIKPVTHQLGSKESFQLIS